MKISFAQCNPTVGDLDGNARLILRHLRQAQENGCDLAVFPELVLTGYPPEDLLLKPAFIAENRAALKSLAARVGATAAVVGFVDEIKGKRYNAAAWLENKKIRTIYHKTCLPNYGVFDEQRYFSAGERPVVVPFRGRKIGLTICEDIWLGNGPLPGAEVALFVKNAVIGKAGLVINRPDFFVFKPGGRVVALAFYFIHKSNDRRGGAHARGQ
jgi:NAD+ synthase (glutamine-hydrolysing)